MQSIETRPARGNPEPQKMPRYTFTTARALTPAELKNFAHAGAAFIEIETPTLEPVRPRLEVYGRRWWQRTTGNTYHSVRVLLDGVEVARCPYAYGYGTQYSQTAVELLKEAGIVPKDHPASMVHMLSDLFEVSESVEQVQRKKDL